MMKTTLSVNHPPSHNHHMESLMGGKDSGHLPPVYLHVQESKQVQGRGF